MFILTPCNASIGMIGRYGDLYIYIYIYIKINRGVVSLT